jgi:hypothetical protein
VEPARRTLTGDAAGEVPDHAPIRLQGRTKGELLTRELLGAENNSVTAAIVEARLIELGLPIREIFSGHLETSENQEQR